MSNVRRVLALTGNGKGKTTSAIGTAIRAKGRGYKVKFYQFLKSKDYGEHIFLKDIMPIIKFGHPDQADFNYEDKDIKSARDGLKKIKEEIENKEKTLVILDEITYPIKFKWFKVEDVINFIKENDNVSFILTGRDMPKELLDISDTATDMGEIKHIYSKGVPSVLGIEF
jgi:cob(I)alamin adenosyltransferase